MTIERYKEKCRHSAIKILTRTGIQLRDIKWEDSELVLYSGGKYIPWRLIVGYNASGAEQLIAELKEPGRTVTVCTTLDKVEEAI